MQSELIFLIMITKQSKGFFLDGLKNIFSYQLKTGYKKSSFTKYSNEITALIVEGAQ